MANAIEPGNFCTEVVKYLKDKSVQVYTLVKCEKDCVHCRRYQRSVPLLNVSFCQTDGRVKIQISRDLWEHRVKELPSPSDRLELDFSFAPARFMLFYLLRWGKAYNFRNDEIIDNLLNSLGVQFTKHHAPYYPDFRYEMGYYLPLFVYRKGFKIPTSWDHTTLEFKAGLALYSKKGGDFTLKAGSTSVLVYKKQLVRVSTFFKRFFQMCPHAFEYYFEKRHEMSLAVVHMIFFLDVIPFHAVPNGHRYIEKSIELCEYLEIEFEESDVPIGL